MRRSEKRYINAVHLGWKKILNHYLSQVGGIGFLNCNIDISKMSLDILPFYRDVFALWGSLKGTPTHDKLLFVDLEMF